MEKRKLHGYKAVLFDFGGTLDSDGEHWLDRFLFLYETLGLHIAPSEIKRAFYYADGLCNGDPRLASLGLRPLMQHHIHLQFEALNLQREEKEKELVDSFCAHSERYLRRNASLLERAKARYRLGLVSNFYGNVAFLCEEAGLKPLLDVILDSAQVGMSKPDPEIFLRALEKLDLPPGRTVFVGDSYERDILPARRLGMKAIWLKGKNPRGPSEDPMDSSITSLTELDGLLT
jgi:putative hydrolase of the HAD superfamily